jgi:hypothetical protein
VADGRRQVQGVPAVLPPAVGEQVAVAIVAVGRRADLCGRVRPRAARRWVGVGGAGLIRQVAVQIVGIGRAADAARDVQARCRWPDR